MLKRLVSICVFCCWVIAGSGQEFNCTVNVQHDKIMGVDGQVFTSMQKAIYDFMNSKKWTTEDFAQNEKIDVKILFNLTSNKLGGDPDSYTATMSIQATRPVYNSAYTTSIVNYVDKDVAFRYTQFSPMRFDDNQVSGTEPLSSNLTALLAYYSYIILALDYDSFAPGGGTALLKKAQNVVNNAPEGKGVSGWKSMESTRNRYWLIDQMLNIRFDDMRKSWYSIHREGLDSMSVKPNEARMRILTTLKRLYQVNKENPSSVYMQFFFSAKTDEIQHLLAQSPKNERPQYITLLNAIDVPNIAKYNSLR